ncbi:MAG: 50S ribosomal protein L10 [Phycisphaeraceae bacterium]|nr:50S ribosomal protein L10 [Phycisphaeraceae bacterium]
MSKPIKSLIKNVYKDLFTDLEGAVVIDIRGINSKVNTELRTSLANQGIRITVVKNNLAKSALAGTGMANIGNVLSGPSAIVHGGKSVVDVARALMAEAKKYDALKFVGALLDGQAFTADQVDALSKYPTREEAQGQVIQLLLAPYEQVLGAALSAGSQIASILKTIEEKLEKGEAITKVA